jgi:catechol 2,3-dioxygenase-like lactoylglutathione lyase family enzyme
MMNPSQVRTLDMKLEVIVIPVSNVDRAKQFYGGLDWRLDADFAFDDGFRVIQFTPPGSGASVIFGTNVTAAAPGSASGLYLVVADIEVARKELLGCGVKVSELFHGGGDVHTGADESHLFGSVRIGGPDPERRSYFSLASFSDPDGNGWLLQEVTARLPGRMETNTIFASAAELAPRCGALRPRMASMRNEQAAMMRTGRTGTPSISSASRSANHCHLEDATASFVICCGLSMADLPEVV